MQNQKQKIIRIISVILCIVALLGFIMPAIHLSMEFLGVSRKTSFNVLSFFEKTESRFGGSNINQADIFNLSGRNLFEDMIADIGFKLVTSVGAYFVTLILLIVILVFIILDKINKSVNIMTAVSFALFIYAGYAIMTVTETLYKWIEMSLGIAAWFVNIYELLIINHGSGYWLTVIMIGCLFLVKASFYINLKRTKAERLK